MQGLHGVHSDDTNYKSMKAHIQGPLHQFIDWSCRGDGATTPAMAKEAAKLAGTDKVR